VRRTLEEAVLPAFVALLVAAVVGDILILSFGQNPGSVYRILIDGTWGNAYGFGQVLYKATTLTFTGLAVAVGLRAGLFNIGAESQLAAGGFLAALAGLVLPMGLPALATLPIYLVAAAAGGAIVGAIPGALKARFGAHEVITTIMLNFIVLALLNYLTAAHLKVEGTLHTAEIHAGALPRLSSMIAPFHGSGGKRRTAARVRHRGGRVVVSLSDATRIRAARDRVATGGGGIRRK
jgi:simple sugar transport system permease protein